jgi:hypothetical protein
MTDRQAAGLMNAVRSLLGGERLLLWGTGTWAVLYGVGVHMVCASSTSCLSIFKLPYSDRLLAAQPPDHQTCCQALDHSNTLGDLGSVFSLEQLRNERQYNAQSSSHTK